MSPFEVDLGRTQRPSLDLVTSLESQNESIHDFRLLLQAFIQDAQYCHELAKAKQSTHSAWKT